MPAITNQATVIFLDTPAASTMVSIMMAAIIILPLSGIINNKNRDENKNQALSWLIGCCGN